jgi:hypothetical protein
MTRTDILEQIGHLPTAQRLAVVESVLHQMREELATPAHSRTQLQQAAEALRQDYLTDSELTAFNTLDGEPVHA